MAGKQDLRHVVSDAPRVMVVDGSKLVRKLIGDTLVKELPNAQVIGCASIAEARKALEDGAVDLVTTALVLPDGDGLALARSVREASGQAIAVGDRKSTRLNSSHSDRSRMPSSA